MNRLTKIFIFIFVLLVSFSFANSAKADWLMSTSTPCGVRLTWNSTGANTTKCIAYGEANWRGERACLNFANKKAHVIIRRGTTYLSNSYRRTVDWPVIFDGDISAVPTSYSYYNDYYDQYYSYVYGNDYTSYTDLTAIPGNTYYYEVDAYDPDSYITPLKTFTSKLDFQYDAINYNGINFQRPQLTYGNYAQFDGNIKNDKAYVNRSYPMYTPTDMSYGENLAEYGSEFSNACPFVQIPGDFTEGWSSFTLSEPSGSKISDLTCSENKYAFADSTTGWFFENIGSADDRFDIIQRYGFSSDKFDDKQHGSDYVSNTIQPAYRIGMSPNGNYYKEEGYDIYKTGSVGFNFYREVCAEGKGWMYDTICTFSKLPTTDYTLTQPRAGYNVVEFNNNYVPPPETDNYFAATVKYRVTSVNQYGAESWPVEFRWVQPLPTCSNDCIDPNTIDPNKIFIIKNVLLSNDFQGISKVLGWNTADNELGQFTYNASSTNQEWYIKPSNESKYAILVSKQDGKALSTDGYIDWSWTHFGEKLYSLFTNDSSGLDIFPGYIKGYENIYTYKGETPYTFWGDWGDQNGEFTIGYKIKKYKEYNPTDDSQKWCIAPEKTAQWNEESTDYIMVNTGNYAFINKNVQAPMKLLNLDYSDPFKNTEGFLVWLNPFDGGYYENDSLEYYSPGRQGNFDLWQLDIPTTTAQSCLLPDGITTIPDAATTTYYKSNRVNGNCDDSSNVEIRTCTNGALTGSATSTSCTEYCVNPTNSAVVELNGAYSTTTILNCVNYQTTYTCGNNGLFTQTSITSTSVTGCTPTTNAPVPKNLNLARLVPSIVNLGYQCKGKVDTGELTTGGLNLSTTTCDIYQVLADGTTASSEYSSGDPMSTNTSNWPGVDPGKDYKIICKDTAAPNYVTAISQTLKCALNPTVREI